MTQNSFSFDDCSDRQMLFFLKSEERNAAFAALYAKHVVTMLNTAYKRLNQESCANDIVHDVFVSFYQNLDNLPLDTNIGGYLHNAVRNRVINQIRNDFLRNWHQGKYGLLQYNKVQIPSPHTQEQLERELENYESVLPKQCKKVYMMRRYQNYSNKQISETLGISVNTVEQHMRRAIKILRKKLNYRLLILLILEFHAMK